MKKVLILNHNRVECGTYQFALRIFNIVHTSSNVEYFHRNTSNKQEYLKALYEIKPDYTVYNYHFDRMPWVTEEDMSNIYTRHYLLFHDGSILNKYDKYIFSGEMPNYPTDIPLEKSVLLPRPLIDYKGSYPKNLIPIIGSFGFATDHKRFPELVTLVNQTFEKAQIRLHITSPYFGVTEGYNLPKIVDKCYSNNTNPNVELTISTNFIDDQGLLKFLAGNDINVFYYEYMKNPGISSAIDYALSVRRPFAVTRNNLFRHVASDDITLENNSIKQILDKGLAPIEKYYSLWSTDNFRKQFDEMFV